ncbi:hypothetical protein H5395_06325 [Paracoccus sp. MC1854]|uniref:hypothetical protein n=1 Tax=Paracoccus sp. MC1854 TaxID=2760306 RepID=UPI0016044C3A|nr:hypothetical protein [Paracoccus sp. MC1854]MBB1491154.1 hypothetical protein [Paracoccus sp. MC1854]
MALSVSNMPSVVEALVSERLLDVIKQDDKRIFHLSDLGQNELDKLTEVDGLEAAAREYESSLDASIRMQLREPKRLSYHPASAIDNADTSHSSLINVKPHKEQFIVKKLLSDFHVHKPKLWQWFKGFAVLILAPLLVGFLSKLLGW